MQWLSEKLKRFEEKSLILLVIIMLGIVFTNVVLRYGFDRTLTWGEELSRFLFVSITYIGASAGIRKKGHIVVDLLVVLFPKANHALTLVSNFLAALFCIFIFIASFKYAHFLKSVDQISTGLGLPMWIPYVGVILGSLMMCFRFCEVFLQLSKSHK